jgi:putative resolvase
LKILILRVVKGRMDEFRPENIPPGFLTCEYARRYIGCSDYALRKWANEGKIEFVRTGERGQRRYNVKGYFERQGKSEAVDEKEPIKPRRKVIYARVSSRGQSGDLENQVEYLRAKFPSHDVVRDVGSGLNYNRKGLRQLLDWAYKGELEEVVVTYKDRLCRWGFEIFEDVFKHVSGAKITVLTKPETSSEQELCDDVISVITVFTASLHGKKGSAARGKKRREKLLQDPKIQDLTPKEQDDEKGDCGSAAE